MSFSCLKSFNIVGMVYADGLKILVYFQSLVNMMFYIYVLNYAFMYINIYESALNFFINNMIHIKKRIYFQLA